MAEILLAVAVLAVPVLLGATAVYAGRPWWWAAAAGVAIFVLVAILPEPEAGESRVAVGDLGFLAVVALTVVGLTWLGAFTGRRLGRTRR